MQLLRSIQCGLGEAGSTYVRGVCLDLHAYCVPVNIILARVHQLSLTIRVAQTVELWANGFQIKSFKPVPVGQFTH